MIRERVNTAVDAIFGTKSSQSKSTTDEQYLNVLRKADRPFVKTGQFAEELDVVQRTAQKRLNALEQNGRVDSESIGKAKIWWLGDSESQQPVGESGAKLLRACYRLERFEDTLLQAWRGLFGIAGFMLLIYLSADAQGLNLPFFGNQGITLLAFLLAISGGFGIGLWGVIRGSNKLLRACLDRGWIGTIGD